MLIFSTPFQNITFSCYSHTVIDTKTSEALSVQHGEPAATGLLAS